MHIECCYAVAAFVGDFVAIAATAAQVRSSII